MTTELHEYPKLKRRFNEYDYSWLSKTTGTYYPNLVWEFFSNYFAFLEKEYPKSMKLNDMGNRPKDIVRGVNINISECILNKVIFGPEYEAPTVIQEP